MDETSSKDVFENSAFAIIISPALTKQLADTISKTIIENGGESIVISAGAKIKSFNELTHIISNTSDFPQYADSQDLLIPVITAGWVTASVTNKKGKLAQLRPYTPDPNLFFSSVILTCGDIPTGDKDAIIGGVVAMGGMEASSLTRLTTHLCALTLDHPKCQEAVKRHPKIKIVLPHWFDDCLKLGKRIQEEPYLLPDPAILRELPEEDLGQPSTTHLRGAEIPQPDNIPVPSDASLSRLNVFKDKTIMISEDLEIGIRIRGILEGLILGSGGKIASAVQDTDIFICRLRAGRDYILASRSGIDVGNLSWLYWLIVHNQWTSPLKRLLHYPLPEGGIPGFKDYKITLSNYGGEARLYLENLVHACGAEFTKSMKPDNTHVITARKAGEKCQAAEEWQIEMINHLWLEESYARCQLQSLTVSKYTHFPPRTNLGEVIGQIQFDRSVLEKLYYSRDPTPSPEESAPKRKVMQEKDRNTPLKKAEIDVEMEEVNDAEEEEEPKSKKVVPKSKAKPRSSITNLSTPVANRRVSAGKENDTPSSTGSRSAKNKALQTIHGLADDIALYEKEKKRKGSIWGGERAASNIDKARSIERSVSPAAEEHEEDDEGEEQEGSEEIRPTKRQKSAKPAKQLTLPPADIRLLITAYKEWTDQPDKEDKERKKLRDLGVLVTQDPSSCTHLAAPAMVRTKKFLCALAAGPTIVSADFIDACLSKGEIPDAKLYALKDPVNEKKFGLKLQDAVKRAKANERNLLRHVPIYRTQEVVNGDEYEAIAKANGATFSIYRARGGAMIKPVKPEEDDGPPEPVYLISGNRPEERKMWSKFEEMAHAGNMIPRIVSNQWLLDVAMSQQLQWDDKYLVNQEG